MNNKPLVSGITIFLNAERFIEEAIESVVAQTYENWELMLVDDGSSDGSRAIATRYAQLYPKKIYYLEHEGHKNLGKSASRNLGFRYSKGEYIAFLDSDDIWLPQKLERQVAILESHPEASMVYGRTLYWYSWTGNSRENRRDKISTLGVHHDKLYQPPILLTRFLKNGGIVPCICSFLVRRQVLLDVGCFEETIPHLYEDQVLLAKVCLQAPVYVENGCGDQYRQHPDSSCYKAIVQGDYHPLRLNPARLNFIAWLSRYFSEQGIKDAALLKTLHFELWLSHYPLLYNLISYVKYALNYRSVFYDLLITAKAMKPISKP